MAVLAVPFFLQFLDNNGVPVRNGKVYTYAAGTTTPKATFTDFTETHQAPNPVPLDAAGRATIWINGAYKFVLVDENDVPVGMPTDNVVSFSTPAEAAEPFSQTFSGDGSNKNFTLSQGMGTDPLNLIVYVDNNDGKGYNVLLPNQYSLNDTALVLGDAPAVGTNNIYVFAPSTLLSGASSSAAAAQSAANAAAVSESNAAESAELAAESAERFKGTSTSSLAIGTGTKVFTTQEDKYFEAGNFVLISSDANVSNFMFGQVTDYTDDQLTVSVTVIGGSGTFADWTIYVSGVRGEKGDTGTIGDLSGVPAGTVSFADDFFVFQDTSDSNQTKRTKLGSVAGSALINDSTMASATSTNVPSAQSIKTYVDNKTTVGVPVIASGTSVDFTGIPAGCKRITILFDNVSTSGTSIPLIQLGDSGGFETTGYVASSTRLSGSSGVSVSSTSGFPISSALAAADISGAVTLYLMDPVTNKWVISGVMGWVSTVLNLMCSGVKSLSNTLNSIRITTTNGTDTFDAGSINIMYYL